MKLTILFVPLYVFSSLCYSQSASWIETERWSGNGIKQTETFEIVGSRWKVTHRNTGGGILQIMVYKGKSLEGLAANTTEEGYDQSVFRSKGLHNFTINSANTDWTVTVEQFLTPNELSSLNAKKSKQQSQVLHLIQSWSGSGIKTTDDFLVSSNPWKIEYSNSGGGILQIMVYKNDNLVSMAANTTESGKGESWVHVSGTFYLTINSANTEWEVKIYEP